MGGIVDNDRSLEALFRGFDRAAVYTLRMLLIVLAFRLFAAPAALVAGLLSFACTW